MAETAKYALENEMGCGFLSALLHLTGFRSRDGVLFQDNPCPKKLRNSSKSGKPQSKRVFQPQPKPIPAGLPMPSKRSDQHGLDAARNKPVPQSQLVNSSYIKRLAREPSITSIELTLTLADDRQKSDPNRTLYRASTGNVMLLGHLENLKQRGNGSRRDKKGAEGRGNVVKKRVETGHQLGNVYNNSMNRLSPDGIKLLGNDKYRQGRYEEALSLYEQAIAIDPSNACYYSNKSAALMGLGRLLEAVVQCREAVRLDPSYRNAHCRLAKLYLRLGVAEKAIYHYKCSDNKAGGDDIARAEALKNCLDRCVEVQDRGDWQKVISESQCASALGADSSPQIDAMKSEALMKLNRHEEAYTVMQDALCLRTELFAECFGNSAAAFVLQVRALVYMANGRFEDAARDVQQALQLDSSDGARLTAERVRAVSSARQNGNRLFKGSRFSEALVAYDKGLEQGPCNSVLLCNRAACRAKLGQYEKAVEDCTAALGVRPSYSKARLRRADCYTKLEEWEAATEDYEVLVQEMPGDKEVIAMLSEAKMQLNNRRQNGCNIDFSIRKT